MENVGGSCAEAYISATAITNPAFGVGALQTQSISCVATRHHCKLHECWAAAAGHVGRDRRAGVSGELVVRGERVLLSAVETDVHTDDDEDEN